MSKPDKTVGPTETTKGVSDAQQARIRELEEVNRRMTAEIADAHASLSASRTEEDFLRQALADLKADRKYLAGYVEGMEQALTLIFGGGHPLPPVRQQPTRPGPESL